MSDFKVPYTQILNIVPHPNADRLEICTVLGFNVVIPKNKYKVGDYVIYIPIDSILSQELETTIFPEDSKIKLHNHRVRQIRIRSYPSQGLIVCPEDVVHIMGTDRFRKLGTYEENEDLSSCLGVTKYEPPIPAFQSQTSVGLSRDRRIDHKLFHSYNGLSNVKWYPSLFAEGEEVFITEKLHGCNARVSLLPYQADTWFRRMLVKLKLAPKYEINYGSNNVQITRRRSYKGFYGTDIYGEALKRCGAFKKLQPNEIVYGEIIGENIQAGYTYGHKEPTFVVFDVKIYNETDGTFKWLSPDEVVEYCAKRGFKCVPTLYTGPYSYEVVKSLAKGPSVYSPSQNVIEGVVIKSRYDYNYEYGHCQRKSLKLINEDYLDKADNTDFH